MCHMYASDSEKNTTIKTPNSIALSWFVLSDVSGVECIVIPLMNKWMIDPWDVLIASSWVTCLFVLELRFTWILVIASSCICMHDRDLSASEALLAIYILRQPCDTFITASDWITVPIIALGIWSRFTLYLHLQPFKRRICTLISVFVGICILHRPHEDKYILAIRVMLYIAASRYNTKHQIDPWDTIAQCIWLLVCTPYTLVLAIPQANDMISSPIIGRRSRSVDLVWTANGPEPREEV